MTRCAAMGNRMAAAALSGIPVAVAIPPDG
jgi:hypothetical protein